jgi:Cd2+/Zn2+-exporting ATPase
MTEHTIELDIPLLLPQIENGQDECLEWLVTFLHNRKGILKAHLKQDLSPVALCIHYDPEQVPLASVRRLAQEAGASFTERYRHESLPFTGLDSADAALPLARSLETLPGMLHAQVNYAAGLVFVAYDSTLLERSRIIRTMRADGAHALAPPSTETAPGRRPALLPGWMQHRGPLILAGLAGLFFLAGWAGARFFGFPESIAVTLFILSYLAGGFHVARHAIPGLFKGRLDTDLLMLAAALGAAALGEWAEGAFLLFLFGLGHAGEHYALDRARHAVNALGDLMPQTAQVKRADQIVEVNVEQLRLGDLVLVRPGDRLPADGTVAAGSSAVDQSPVTGESVPVEKAPGDEVFAGTINQDAALEVKVTRLAADNTLARVMQLVAEAQSQQSPTQQSTERFTRRFVPAVLGLVLLVVFVPPLAGWLPLRDSFYRGMLLLVAASPCALALGTPAAVLAGIAQAARSGVLIKGGAHLEMLGSLTTLAFDKTGTLTTGEFRVTAVVPLNGATEDEVLGLAAAVEQRSNHPLARAVVRAAQVADLPLPSVSNLENVAGLGVTSTVAGLPVKIGSLKMFLNAESRQPDDELVRTVERFEAAGETTMVVHRDGAFLGVLALADTPRPGVAATLQQLLAFGVRRLVMLTGDHETAARRIAAEVGVTEVQAGLLPEDKLDAIRELRQAHGAVAMIGDGVNDAPALAAATVGIAMGGAGTAVALETADVALMADDLSRLPFAIGLSRASRAVIRQNLAISLGVIGLLLLTSVLGVVQLSGAVVLHEGSTILVVLNALRLLRYHS